MRDSDSYGWAGGKCKGASPSCSFALFDSVSVTATFAPSVHVPDVHEDRARRPRSLGLPTKSAPTAPSRAVSLAPTRLGSHRAQSRQAAEWELAAGSGLTAGHSPPVSPGSLTRKGTRSCTPPESTNSATTWPRPDSSLAPWPTGEKSDDPSSNCADYSRRSEMLTSGNATAGGSAGRRLDPFMQSPHSSLLF